MEAKLKGFPGDSVVKNWGSMTTEPVLKSPGTTTVEAGIS